MSDQIATAFVQQFRNNVMMLAQQKGSRLRGSVLEDTVKGDRAFVEQIGATAMVQKTSRHADVSYQNTPHDRRMLILTPFEWADLIDNPDRVRTLIDPTNPYAMNAGDAAGRQMDDTIISGLTGTALSGVAGGTSNAISLTVPVDFVDGTVGGDGTARNLTVAKVRYASYLLNNGDVDEEDRHFAASANEFESLLRDPEFKSKDYNDLAPLVIGGMQQGARWMGFTWHRLQRLAKDSNNVRTCIAWHKTGCMLGIGENQITRIDEIPTKGYSTQVYVREDIGAVRLEEEKVVTVLCDEDE